MFLGHAPAGYLWTRFLMTFSRQVTDYWPRSTILLLGIISSLIPDIDLFYFYLIDHRNHLHHHYWTHMPLLWITVFGIWLLTASLLKKPRIMVLGMVLGSNILLHLVLDTIAGKIRWLYPFSNMDFVFAHVPAVHGWWVWNFVFHWTFLFEIVLLAVAIYVWRSGKKSWPDLALAQS